MGLLARRFGASASSVLAGPGRPVNAASAASVNTMCSLASTSYVLSWPVASSRTPGALRRLFQVSSSSASATTRTRTLSLASSSPMAVRSTAIASRVLGCSPSTKPLTTAIRPLAARSDSAPRSAAAFIFLGVRCTYERGWGPCTVPPPAYCGARSEPWRARPVPFWR